MRMSQSTEISLFFPYTPPSVNSDMPGPRAIPGDLQVHSVTLYWVVLERCICVACFVAVNIVGTACGCCLEMEGWEEENWGGMHGVAAVLVSDGHYFSPPQRYRQNHPRHNYTTQA